MFSRAVVLKVGSPDPRGSAARCQGVREELDLLFYFFCDRAPPSATPPRRSPVRAVLRSRTPPAPPPRRPPVRAVSRSRHRPPPQQSRPAPPPPPPPSTIASSTPPPPRQQSRPEPIGLHLCCGYEGVLEINSALWGSPAPYSLRTPALERVWVSNLAAEF